MTTTKRQQPTTMDTLTLASPGATSVRTLASHAQGLLRQDILAGRLAPGQRLRTRELQSRYGLGLSPLRESMQRLSAEGLIVNDEQRGFAVAPVSIGELEDLVLARTALESILLPMAVKNGNADWEAEILAAFHRLSRTPLPKGAADDAGAQDDASLWEARHRAFHHALVVGCGSPWLLRLHAQLVDQSERYRKIRILHHQERKASVRDVNAEHQALMEAVLRRDSARASALMAAHLEATGKASARLMQAARSKEK